MTGNNKLKVFYDGKCGLCAREIDYYRRRDTQEAIEWVDVTVEQAALAQDGITLATALKHMHARMQDGQLVRGVDAFIAIWKYIPGWQSLAKIAALPVIKQCLDVGYEIFAWVRFKSYRHCRVSEQQ